MSETSTTYPSKLTILSKLLIDSLVFGFSAGIVLNMITRAATYEPLAARPWSYLATGAVIGVTVWYYDYWRRRAIEEVLYADERRRYHRKNVSLMIKFL